MKSFVVPRLVNSRFGDPGLYLSLRWQGRALLFDLGRIGRTSPGDLLRLTHVFVSHAHMDHFMGFDHLLRLFLPRDLELHLYGPEGFLDRIGARLAGYTWNLTESYAFVVHGHEVTTDVVRSARFPAAKEFRREQAGERPFDGVLLDEEDFAVDTAILDHKIPCLAFALREKTRLNVDKDALDRLALRPGRWLAELKRKIREEAPPDTPVLVTDRTTGTNRPVPLGELERELLLVSRGQKIGYVVDALYNDGNRRRIVDLVRGADVFFCEAPFLEEDADQAAKRYHLTARQAGLLAREAGVHRLEVFHFSPRYDGQADRIHAEARTSFRGANDVDACTPVAGTA